LFDDALFEIRRVSRPGGTVLISTPLHPARWTAFDDLWATDGTTGR
jgi:hypothetical protein